MKKREIAAMTNLDVLVKTLADISGKPEAGFRLVLCGAVESGELKPGKLLEPCPNPDELLAAFQEEAAGILAWMVKGGMLASGEGNERLVERIIENQKAIVAAAREGLKKRRGAILFSSDEEFQTVQFRFFSEAHMKQIVTLLGLGTHYTFVRKLCGPLTNMVPVVAELHTPDDKLFRCVTQLELV